MKITTVLLPTLLVLSSCASMLNSHFTSVEVSTTTPARIIVEEDTISTTNRRVHLAFERKNEPVEITIETDSTAKTIRLESKNSAAFWLNIYTYGIGFIKDWNDPKRWTYHRRIHVDTKNNDPIYFRYSYFRQKGDLCWTISIPYLNSFYLQPEDFGVRQGLGFLGIGTGIDYYYRDNKFVSLNVQAAMDFPIFVPAPINFSDGDYERLSTVYLSLIHQHRSQRFTFGYGLSYGKNLYQRFPSFDLAPFEPSIRKVSYSFGAVIPVAVQLGNLFHCGLTYRPTFFRANADPKFKYEHLLSVDFAWKIKI